VTASFIDHMNTELSLEVSSCVHFRELLNTGPIIIKILFIANVPSDSDLCCKLGPMLFGKSKPKNLLQAGLSEEVSGQLVDNDGITSALHGPKSPKIVEVMARTMVGVELGGDAHLSERP
jgi:hypothetical protein